MTEDRVRDPFGFLTREQLLSEFRDFKMGVVSGEIHLNPNPNLLANIKIVIKKDTSWLKMIDHKELLDFICNLFPNDIISGSVALAMFGFVSRTIEDIDILIEDESRFPTYSNGDYGEMPMKNRLGFKTVKWKSGLFSIEREWVVDLFHNNYGASFFTIEWRGKYLKVHNPLEIISHKLNAATNSGSGSGSWRKHNGDLGIIFSSVR